MKFASIAALGFVCALSSAAFAQPAAPGAAKAPKPATTPKAGPAKPAATPKAAAPAPAAAPVPTPAPAPTPATDAAPATAPESPSAAAPSAPAAPADAAPCPPGAVCETAVPSTEASSKPAASEESNTLAVAADGTVTLQIPPPPPGSGGNTPRVVVLLPATEDKPERAVLIEGEELANLQLPADIDGQDPEEEEPPVRRRRLPPLRVEKARWGAAIRGVGAFMGSGPMTSEGQGIGGLGGSLRHRPIPAVALELGADFVGGVDSNGWMRREVPLTASALFYFNPKNRAQFYLLGGLNLSFAAVQSNAVLPNLAGGNYDEYTYAGMQAGVGFEYRLSTSIGFHVEGLGVARTRIDDDGKGRYPEHFDARTGLASNSSALGLGRAGISLWW